MKIKAEFVKCPNGDTEFHNQGDGCIFCAPWWIDIAVCPIKHGEGTGTAVAKRQWKGGLTPFWMEGGVNNNLRQKLATSGYCRKCRKYYDTKQ